MSILTISIATARFFFFFLIVAADVYNQFETMYDNINTVIENTMLGSLVTRLKRGLFRYRRRRAG